MAREKKKVKNIDDRSRYIKLLLYPDNPDHLRVYDGIVHGDLLSGKTYDGYIGIIHKLYDDDGNIISTGQGKEHWHIWLAYNQPKPIVTLCRKFEFYRDDVGTPDDTFVRAFQGELKSGLPYLTHLSTPAKEQYSRSDLFGTSSLIDMYDRAALDWITKKYDCRDGLRACMDWIDSRSGVVKARDFLRWIVDTPYIKMRNDKSVWAYIDDHNAEIYRQESRFDSIINARPLQQISSSFTFSEVSDEEWKRIQPTLGVY